MPWHWTMIRGVLCPAQALISSPTLAFRDTSNPFPGTDVSEFAVGAVLSQDHSYGLQPVA